MHDQKKFSFIYRDGASLKKLTEEKEQISLGLAFRFEQQKRITLAERFNQNTLKEVI